jgi:hypothetical protein
MASIVNKSNLDNPKGVILEAPFNNMRDEVIKHPFSWVSFVQKFQLKCKMMIVFLKKQLLRVFGDF